jgi:predicted nucleotide-binding protein (sugar kinase/HSP70/actin superfamily)
MKITFPHLGNAYISVKGLLDDLGVTFVIPPFNNRETLETGTRYTPEMACLPLKITIGNLAQAHLLGGADTVLMAGGRGPCRFGYYCEMQREILQDMGIDMEFIVLEPPKGHLGDYLSQLKGLVGGKNPVKLGKCLINFLSVVQKVDEMERMTFKIRPMEEVKGSTDSIYDTFRKEVLKVEGSESIKKLISKTMQELGEVRQVKGYKPLRIGIVGEIFTSIEPFASFELQQRLGNLGVEVDRKVTLSNWIVDHIIKKGLHLPVNKDYMNAAEPYLGRPIGGHACETIGNTVLYAQKGYDGVIQTFPLSCMPEIVAEGILKKIEKDYGIPVLTLIIDEMTGEAGFLTRIDAFMDMLWRRREQYGNKKEEVLSWH